jgi:RloB-like protein
LPAILVVCEGRETERNYIFGLCDRHRINRANVIVETGGNETSALQLVRKARGRFGRDRDFDAVFVVCDRDNQDLGPAHAEASVPLRSASGKRFPIQLIVTDPCFEFWLILHFEYVARSLTAQEAIQLLRCHVTDYEKFDRRIYEKVHIGLERAVLNAARLKEELRRISASAPDSDMASLVTALLRIRR